ncbi:C6 finger domain protein, putative [Talaromyces stipitatus ATCC 10500]|uniref:C6 finger domain protein, putative n=1 Tax=Talaromyces stipitatus (strain ATCC 10500 / CBS 375.48 / QM 6759 / NRRL 1006) TaxID=441959 RepID=B8M1X4_TALSN|nr:C6 finger domain protein, putative [Talaromyces stipitatus ATCC 10500]EED21352.1 C6 finger domain protein, putative [Talaromyces stipitatus ATCC 10500]
MVYCGKPSKGCGACRARKVKCDQATPSCQRCLKANRVCPGYRDQLSLLFRDQSNSVAKKAKANKSSASSRAGTPFTLTAIVPTTGVTTLGSWDNCSTPPTDYDLIQTSARSSPSVESSYSGTYNSFDQRIEADNFSLTPALIDRRQQAICYCVNSFIWLNGSLIKGIDYDADVSSTSSMAQRAMMKGILSVGMANLSRIGAQSPSMKITAQEEYYKALKCTNAAISHPTQATDDATLTAILCLSLFEILTSKTPETVDAFVEHTKGAVALLELRGKSQLVRPQALQMFEFMRSEIIVTCLMRRSPIPPTLLTLSETATRLPNAPDSFKISHQMCVLMSRVNDLRNEEKAMLDSTDYDTIVVSRAFALDAAFETIVNGLPPEFTAELYTLPPDQSLKHPVFRDVHLTPLNGIYHVYQSAFICVLHNHYRYGRIFINEILLNRLARMTTQPEFVPTPEFKDLCHRLCDTSRKLANDICATVPYLCGFLGDQQPSRSPFKSNPAGGLALLFPLFTAVSVDGHGSDTCRWIEETYKMIGRQMGIDQALALAQLTMVETGTTKFVDRL